MCRYCCLVRRDKDKKQPKTGKLNRQQNIVYTMAFSNESHGINNIKKEAFYRNFYA